MKLGLFTAALPGLSLEEVARWAAENGFESLEIACWPYEKASRRYAGVTHINVDGLTVAKAKEIRAMLDNYGLDISSVGYYPNPLQPDLEARHYEIEHLKKLIEAAELLDVPVVGTFTGRDKAQTIEANLEEFAKVWPPIVKFAAEHGRKIAIENCPMLFSNDEWPGGNNLARSPDIWRKLWEIIPDDNFGLNLDPSHLILQMIDYERVVHEFKDRIFHVHAKDLMIDWEGVYQHGVFSSGMGWQVPRLPGFGDVKWNRFIGALYAVGYNSYVSIEHEDRAFEGSETLVKQGFLIARDVLRPYIH
ncbi:MAG: sugar phosphate isomerase/epimerase [Chloroflexi bacterium]|jgi:sugar phosphate isomerase/epimerase|nr:sugar phosphate isomerase/epimerase [Anaerolineaceae bacterium]NMB87975.1 sugar phosphate isomerase/epimerase [Chloroflexota bacterium]